MRRSRVGWLVLALAMLLARRAHGEELEPGYGTVMLRATLVGMVSGAVVGGIVYALKRPGGPRTGIVAWGAGGALVGAGAGGVQLMMRESQLHRRMVERYSEPNPQRTFFVPLVRGAF